MHFRSRRKKLLPPPQRKPPLLRKRLLWMESLPQRNERVGFTCIERKLPIISNITLQIIVKPLRLLRLKW